MPFEEPEVLASFDRTWGENKEELRLERGTYKDKPTYTLRLCWQAPDGMWRWAKQKPTQSGNCWERLNLKAAELRELGQALIDASNNTSYAQPARAPRPSRAESKPSTFSDDDIPF